MACQAASWIPNAVATILRADSTAQPIIAWLTTIRDSTEEYDPLVTVKSDLSDTEDSDTSTTTTPDSAFDEILSQLGKEIYKLDEYQKILGPGEEEISLSILNIFDECLEGFENGFEVKKVVDGFEVTPIPEISERENCEVTLKENSAVTKAKENGDVIKGKESGDVIKVKENGDVIKAEENCDVIKGKENGDVIRVKENGEECSDCESTLSDVSFVTSTPAKSKKVSVNTIFYQSEGTPLPPRRSRLKTPSSSSSCYDNMELKTNVNNAIKSDSDSESTCWSYKECSDADDPKDRYAAVWSHSTGFHNSDDIMRRVLSQNHATISRLSFDTASEFTPTQYSVYALAEVGDNRDRCEPVADMTPDKPDDGYEPVRDALTNDENIYEEIEYGYSFTDEGCSCGGSVEVESCSISASSEGVGRDSPVYANLTDNDAYAVTADVLYWRNVLLLDPYYNEDEEDEWISPEESVVYTREVRPPLVIPRITQYRAPRRDIRPVAASYEESEAKPITVKSSVRQYERLQDWNYPDGRRLDERYAASGSPPFQRLHKKMSGSTENLLAARRPMHLPLPASSASSGDSLDVEVRNSAGYNRSRKSKSMVPSKRGLRSPVPAPRTVMPDMVAHEGLTVVHEGALKRTKYFEGGKKAKKNWVDCYMVLTTSALIGYKDLRTYQASKLLKPPGTPPSPSSPRPDLILPLKNAHVIQCAQSQTRRYMKSIELTVSHDRFLLQDDSEEGARRWLREIQNVIYRLGPPTDDNLSIMNQSSNTDLESLGRTPPASRHSNRSKQKAVAYNTASGGTNVIMSTAKQSLPTEDNNKTQKEQNSLFEKNKKITEKKPIEKSPSEKSPKNSAEKSHSKFHFFGSSHNLSEKHEKQEKSEKKNKESRKMHSSKRSLPGGSSNEDLSDCTEPANKSYVRSRLKKFFLKRPSMEQLIKKGIYKDEPVFGRNLSEVVPADANPRVPPFVVACIREIESNEENMCTDGLYRASGNLSQVQKIRLDIDQNKLSSIEDNADIHVLTGSLKLFFRELKEPLIPCNVFDRVLAACSIKPREAKIKEFREIVNLLPPCNRDTLKYLLEHLLRVTKYSERNRMHTANLAIVFGPTLLWAPAEQAHNIAIDCIQQNNVVDTLLTEYHEIFAEDGKARRKS